VSTDLVRGGPLASPGAATCPTPFGGLAVPVTQDVVAQFRAMACDVTVRVAGPMSGASRAVAAARAVFENVERACTRFDPGSPLMRANADPESWHQVPVELFDAVAAAEAAYHETAGLFDPRVLRTLESLGYDRSLPFASGPVVTPATPGHDAAGSGTRMAAAAAWRPRFGADGRSLVLGPDPIDLGGIGKGLAVRWAAERLAGAGRSALVEAGGDCAMTGPGPDGDGWKVGVEDPLGGSDPLAVLSVTDLACATSSVRLRRWRSGEDPVHHLIDPRTQRPGGAGLVAVTVVGPDPARAEVWSKALFLAGRSSVRQLAQARGLTALWVHDDGTVGSTPAMDDLVVWRPGRVS
jgi:thiamine biosynthesis lipoprotein